MSSSGQPSSYPGVLRWAHDHAVLLGLGLALLSLVVAVLTLLATGTTEASPTPSPSITSVGTSTSRTGGTTAPTSSSPSPRSTTTAQPTDGCLLPSTAEPAPCDDPTAVLVVGADDCAPRSLLSRWTLDPTLDSLDLSVDARDGACWVRPGRVAAAAGATAADVRQVVEGTVPAVLRHCSDAAGTLSLACSQRHEIEWVGSWGPASGTDDAPALCARRGADYTGMVIEGPERLVALVVQRGAVGAEIRCAVKVEAQTLAGSLRDLDGRPIPRA